MTAAAIRSQSEAVEGADVFDLSSLPPELAQSTIERTQRIGSILRKTAEDFAKIGRELLEAQAELDRGLFGKWIETLPLSKSSAYRAMDVAQHLGGVLPKLGSLPLMAVQALAAAPEPVRVSVLKRMDAGEKVEPAVILREAKIAREEKRQSDAAEKEATRRAKLSPEKRALEDARGKRDAKSKALRAKRHAEQDAKWAAERDEEHKTKTEAAYVLLRAMGADALAAFTARYGAVGSGIVRRAKDVAQIERARLQPIFKISVSSIDDPFDYYHHETPEEAARAEVLAADIRENGLKEPLLVVASDRPNRPLRILDGRIRFLALRKYPRPDTINVRIAPEPDQDALEAVLAEPTAQPSAEALPPEGEAWLAEVAALWAVADKRPELKELAAREFHRRGLLSLKQRNETIRAAHDRPDMTDDQRAAAAQSALTAIRDKLSPEEWRRFCELVAANPTVTGVDLAIAIGDAIDRRAAGAAR